jgi:hypothetical protein
MFKRLVLLVLVLLAVLFGGVALLLDRGVAAAVEKGASHALGVPTTVDSVSIRPFRGSAGIDGLSVANPAGFSEQPCLALGHAGLELAISSVMKDTIEIPLLELSDITLRLEGRGTKTNYGALLDNLKRVGGDSGSGKPDSKPEEGGTSQRFIVRELVIRGVSVELDYAVDSPLGKLAQTNSRVSLPEIRLNNIGNGESLSMAQLTAEIFRALMEAAASGNIPGLSGDIAKDLQRGLADLKSSAKDLGKQLENSAKDLLRGGDAKPEDAIKGVKDLFKKN